MKKLNIILCAAAAAMLAFACSKSEQVNTPDEKENNTETPVDVINPDGTRTITVKIVQPVTESLWEDGEGFNWGTEGNASFGIFTDNNDNLSSTSVAKNGTDISITATVDGNAKKAVFYYPAGIAYSMVTSTTEPNTYFRFENMANQVQTAAGSMNFDVEDADGNMGLVSSAVLDLTATSSPFEVTMTPIVALVRFIVYSSTGSSASVKSITLTADSATNHLNGQENISFNFSTGDISSIFSAAGTLSNKVTLTEAFSLSGVTSASKSSGIYMSTQPTVITGYTITLKMDDDSEYKFSTASSLTLAAGHIKNIPLDLDNAMPIFSVDKTSHSVLATATSATINVTAFKAPWTAEVRSGSATISPSSGSESGSITVSFAENLSTTDENVYVIRVSTTAAVATQSYDITITQAVAGGGPVLAYSYSIEGTGGASGSYIGAGAGSNIAGCYVRITNIVRKDSGAFDIDDDDIRAEILAQATSNVAPDESELEAGYKARTKTTNSFFYIVSANKNHPTWGTWMEIGFNCSGASAGEITRCNWIDDEGNELGHYYIFTN